ncbi:LacI family DNA-binding transcriptional regulator [Pseudolysinimonas sp.]|jgi:DNA-binding LacI/PurR family transcriptional regulator|uniref:LacI family DNA-binding transcriptional regulator n=1 Tax=Pseudolysinimonas sp. TaxID=2680009 RepID=UPI0037849955
MTSPVTIHDVAQAAQVSIATVSNAMNRPGRVAADTRTRVLDAADRLGYVPHAIAAHRARTARERIGVIAPFVTHSSYTARIQGILPVLGADHMEALVFDHPSASRSPSPRLATLPFSGNLDGLVIMGVPVDTGLADRLLTRGVPTVLVDSRHPQFTSVVLDEDHGAATAAEHLVGRGYTRFVYVTEGQISNDFISQGKRRLAGFLRALADLGVEEERVHRLTARAGDAHAGRLAADAILSLAEKDRVGVLAGHDILAAGMLAGFRSRHVDIPGRVGVMGWDGGELVEALGVTTMRQPLAESGRVGAERLISHMRDASAPVERIVLMPTLVPGITT